MKRAQLRRRTPLRRGTRRIGQAARERVRAGGPLAVGRASLPLVDYRLLVSHLVIDRAHGRCEFSGQRGLLDPAHVRARSAGGQDSADNIVILAREIHEQMSAPYRTGRLLIAPLGGGAFCYRIVVAEHKWALKTVEAHEHTPALRWLLAEGVPAALRLDRVQANAAEVAACPRRCG